MTTIVIARYKENLKWIKDLPNDYKQVIYNKGEDLLGTISLENIGREAHTYLYYIVNNYEKLDDYTIFCQGHPFDHCKNFLQEINKRGDYIEFADFKPQSQGNGLPHHGGLKIHEASQRFFGFTKPWYGFPSGAQFIVSKENILKHPKSLYEEMLRYCYEYHEAAWVMERLWRILFNPS